MCRLFAITSKKPKSPMLALEALEVMKEGHDASGVGLVLRDLAGPFEDFKNKPILSAICTKEGWEKLDKMMIKKGFTTKYAASIYPKSKPPVGIPKRYTYLIRAYDYPESWEILSEEEKKLKLMLTRLEIRNMGQKLEDIIIFSFWPDTITIKEIGDPIAVGKYLELDKSELKARIIMAQGRQNTNYDINLYACHPFFLLGYSTMTNGENTAFVPIKEYLLSRGFEGYIGYQSDSEVFTHILHYAREYLKLPIEYYKHVITPLNDENLHSHSEANFLKNIKMSCRKLNIDGPNCVIGTQPDNSMFMVQDKKKLRPGIVGGKDGFFVFSSEACGLDMALPNSIRDFNFQPMHLDTVVVDSARKEIKVFRQNKSYIDNLAEAV